VKLKYTIVLVFLCTSHLLAANSTATNTYALDAKSVSTVENSEGESILKPSKIAADDGAILGTISGGEDETLDSVLGYFIIIFFSVLVIILIDNRNLEKRYKKLVADFKSKDPTG